METSLGTYRLDQALLKLKLQYFGHRMERTDSLEKTLMLGKIEGRRRRGSSCFTKPIVSILKKKIIKPQQNALTHTDVSTT